MPSSFVKLAKILGAHGVHGALRVCVFSGQAETLKKYRVLRDEAGTLSLNLRAVHALRRDGLARIACAGLGSREEAASLAGTEIGVLRAQLPEISEPDNWYCADLIGLDVLGPDERSLGSVRAVHNFGGGDVLEFGPNAHNTVLIPFSGYFVPRVDCAAGFVRVEHYEEFVNAKCASA